MLITVQRITGEIAIALAPAAATPAPQGALKKRDGPEMVLPSSVARLERAADDHGRRIAGIGLGSRSVAPRRSSAPAGGGRPFLSPSGAAGGSALEGSVRRSIRMSRGEPLPAPTLGKLESHFGRGLGDVRVHTDRAAGEAAKTLRAQAFALGSHIYFAPGRFNPATAGGLGLLGHEVAHVDQFYRGLSGLGATHAKGLSVGSDRLERFADDHERRLAGSAAHVGTAIESFSFTCSQSLGPAAQAALERITEGAVARASEELSRDRLAAIIDELKLDARVDLNKGEDSEIRVLAGKIVLAARRKARPFGTSSSPGAVFQLRAVQPAWFGGVVAPRKVPQSVANLQLAVDSILDKYTASMAAQTEYWSGRTPVNARVFNLEHIREGHSPATPDATLQADARQATNVDGFAGRFISPEAFWHAIGFVCEHIENTARVTFAAGAGGKLTFEADVGQVIGEGFDDAGARVQGLTRVRLIVTNLGKIQTCYPIR